MPRAVWLLVAAAAASISLALGVRQTFGLFLLPLAVEEGLSPAILGGSFALHNLVWGLAQPVSGALADRHGAGRVMASGSLLLAAGLVLPSLLPGSAAAACTRRANSSGNTGLSELRFSWPSSCAASKGAASATKVQPSSRSSRRR